MININKIIPSELPVEINMHKKHINEKVTCNACYWY